ncbi:MAG: class II D-tagatose-bisphosphate aldolase, non-catalytic subunit [Clostridiaceae bacterium]|nr:class II D-tagatose-bisphosphate aldolase, non-catalytic subunit [Clostridiaceae bacterium]
MNTFGSPSTILDRLFTKNNDSNKGLFSICSSNHHVIEAGMHVAKQNDSFLLIESTCNQVNQFGGYSGMTPIDFVNYIRNISLKNNFPLTKIILGGDHLGPYPWRSKDYSSALQNAKQLVRDYVAAGFRKIHLDASMPCLDDDQALNKELSAKRAVDLCKIAETTLQPGDDLPLYVIGTEVPAPGGQTGSNEKVQITSYQDISETIDFFKSRFIQENLASAWERVIAVVVQPGVDFNDSEIFEYDRAQVGELKRFISCYNDKVFEAHSTDYQTQFKLRQMVEDKFSILKVGPALTFAFREVIFGLAKIEEELLRSNNDYILSNIIKSISLEMDRKPEYWKNHVTPSNFDIEVSKLYGFSDRVRYYWNSPDIRSSIYRLICNLEKISIPLSLLSQFLPLQYHKVREQKLNNTPRDIIIDHIIYTLDNYSFACGFYQP